MAHLLDGYQMLLLHRGSVWTPEGCATVSYDFVRFHFSKYWSAFTITSEKTVEAHFCYRFFSVHIEFKSYGRKL